MATKQLNIQFTEFIPEDIEEGVLYISMEYATASHRCACGCGEEVITPFTPTDWKLIYDGESVSLSPSIGNWSYPCRAHYFIRNNMVTWASDMSQRAIEAGRRRDIANKAFHYAQDNAETVYPNYSSDGTQAKKSRSRAGRVLAILTRFLGFKRANKK